METELQIVEKVSQFLEYNLGLTHYWANQLDSILIFVVIFLVAGVINFALKFWLMPLLHRFVRKTKNKWDDLLFDGNVVAYISHIIPVYFVYHTLPLAFLGNTPWLVWLQKFVFIVLIFLLVSLVNAALNVIDDVLEGNDSLKGHPYRLIFQVIKVIVFLIGLVCAIGILVNRSPMVLLTGLGASAAIVSLVFKDTIVGFVSGLQLTANGMVQKGDWISLPSMNVDGYVLDISLHTVKVQNFDKSIATVPPSTLLNSPFLNWRKMQKNGARRIKRSIKIDFRSIHLCTPEELEALRNMPYMPAILDAAKKAGNMLPDGAIMSNLMLFREYLTMYIKDQPYYVPGEVFMIRQLPPSEYGLPLEIYFFIKEVKWEKFEAVQTKFFSHVFSVLPVFNLNMYQR